MSAIRRKGLCFAMEEAEVEAPASEPTTEVPGEVESDVADVNTDAAAIDDLNVGIEETLDEIDNLEDVHATMDESVEKGEGLDDSGAKMAEIAVESMQRRLGISTIKVMVGMEAFGSTQTRVTATKIAMEGVMQTIAAAWAAIKKAFATMWEQIKGFFKKLLDANIKVGAAAKAMAATIDASTKDKTKSKEKLENSGVFSALSIGGKADAGTTDTLLANAASIVGVASTFVDAGQKVITEVTPLVDALKEASKAEGAETADNSELSTKVRLLIKSSNNTVAGVFRGFEKAKNQTHEGMDAVQSPILAGGKAILVAWAVTENTSGNTAGVYKCEVIEAETGDRKGEVCDVLTPEQMKKICATVQANTAKIDQLKVAQGKLGNFEKSINKVIDSVVSKLGSMNGQESFSEDNKKALGFMKKIVTDTNGVMGAYSTKAPQLAVATSKAALNYVQASLKLYGAAKAA